MAHVLLPISIAIGVAAVVVAAALTTSAVARPSLPVGGSSTPLARENAHPGATTWAPLEARGPDHNIEGYSSEVSLYPGQTLHLHVSVRPAGPYQIQFYRLGWYGGKEGRLLGCIPHCSRRALQGASQPIPQPDPQTGILRLKWKVTTSFTVPKSWISGYYIARLVHSGGLSTVPFFVRQPRSQRASRILVVSAINTEEAYDPWGGKSLYDFNSTDHHSATHVSFDRPFTGTWFFELGLLHTLERLNDVDVSYATDVDIDRDPSELLRHRFVMVVGHDEYWSSRMRDAYEAARDHGVNLSFWGGDYGDWQIRYEDDDRTIVEYRDPNLDPDPDPVQKTTNFSRLQPPRPQCQILGTQFGYGAAEANQPKSFRINPAAANDPWLAGTSLKAGTTFTGIGNESDGVAPPGCLPYPVTTFFTYTPRADFAPAVRYRAASGATVFSAGSYALAFAADSDPRIRRFIENIVRSMSR
jgi:hypothetical protein